MKCLIILFATFLYLSGCKDITIKKPFVIVRKEYHDHATYYGLRDANGNFEGFYERDTVYHIGDTIK